MSAYYMCSNILSIRDTFPHVAYIGVISSVVTISVLLLKH